MMGLVKYGTVADGQRHNQIQHPKGKCIMKTKTNECLKVVFISILSIALFSAAFMGFNQVIFVAATAQPTPIHPPIVMMDRVHLPSEPPEANAESTSNAFAAPSLNVFPSPHQHYHAIPTAALSMDAAAQIGARYVWDVFNASLDGMYVEMLFNAHPSQSRSYWTGTVRAEWFDYAHIADDDRDARIAYNDAVLYQFRIDAITGKRIDIRSSLPSSKMDELRDQAVNNTMTERNLMMQIGWFDMHLCAQLQFLGVTPSSIASYIVTAQSLGNAHFGTQGLTGSLRGVRTQWGDDGLVMAAIQYVLTYNNREAIITVPASAAFFGSYNVETHHNDFIPGFRFNDGGQGRG